MLIFNGILWWLLLAVKVFALADCVRRWNPLAANNAHRNDFEMADTLPGGLWTGILTFAILADLIRPYSPISFLSLLGTLAALVYLAQLRGSSY